MDWEIRQASAADVDAVAELRAVVLRAGLERLGRYDEQRVRQRLRSGFDPSCTWVIEVRWRVRRLCRAASGRRCPLA